MLKNKQHIHDLMEKLYYANNIDEIKDIYGALAIYLHGAEKADYICAIIDFKNRANQQNWNIIAIIDAALIAKDFTVVDLFLPQIILKADRKLIDDNEAVQKFLHDNEFDYEKFISGDEIYNSNGETPLTMAVKEGRLSIIETLLKYGVRIREENVAGMQPHELSKSDARAIIYKYVLNTRQTAFYAIQAGHKSALEATLPKLSKKELINETISHNGEKLTLLEIAFKFARYDMIYLLVTKYNLDITEKCINFEFAETKSNDTAYLEWLIARIGKQNIISNSVQMNLLEFAFKHARQDIIDILLSKYDYVITEKCTAFELEKAIKNDDLDYLKKWLKNGGNPNHKTHDGSLLLHFAAKEQKHLALRILLDHKASINIKDDFDKTALALLAESKNGWELCMRELLYRGADPNLSSTIILENQADYATPLCTAAANVNLAMCEMLIQSGALVHTYTHNGLTPAYIAATAGDLECLKFLLKEGGQLYDRSIVDDNNQIHSIPFWLQVKSNIKKNNSLMLTFLQKYTSTNNTIKISKNYKNEMLDILFHAATIGEETTLQNLINIGANINWTNNNGDTVLGIVIANGHYDCMFFLVKQGCYINHANNQGTSAFLFATNKSFLPFMRFLADNGADIHQEDNNGVAPLHIAAENCFMAGIKFLLTKGAKIEILDQNKKTPLLYAAASASSRATEVIDFLLSEGANLHHTDKQGETALFKAIKTANEPVIKLLLSTGSEINISNDAGETPLYVAVFLGLESIVKEILSYEHVDIDKTCPQITALELAKQKNLTNIVKLLEDYKINPTLATESIPKQILNIFQYPKNKAKM